MLKADKFTGEKFDYKTGKVGIKGVKRIFAVSSGKGGVGKSTTAANLALAIKSLGYKVGVLDADIHGPSQALILNVPVGITRDAFNSLNPSVSYDMQVLSMALMNENGTPMTWRGPMAVMAFEKMLKNTTWDVDYLVIDMPPGTGDIQLFLANKIHLDSAIIVTTPQDVALIDVERGLKLFVDSKTPVAGVVENMAMHICSECGHVEHIFGESGGKTLSEKFGVELLASIPLEKQIRITSDSGKPIVLSDPDHIISKTYKDIAQKLVDTYDLIEEEDDPQIEQS